MYVRHSSIVSRLLMVLASLCIAAPAAVVAQTPATTTGNKATAPTTASQPASQPAPAPPVVRDTISSPFAMSAQVGVPLSYSILAIAAKGGIDNTPTSYGASDLAPGLAVASATGIVTGTPTEAGIYKIGISATNTLGTGSGVLTLTVYPEHPTTATTVMHLRGTTEAPFGYLEFLPKNYYLKPQGTFPVIIDLCGAGNIANKAADPYGINFQNKLWQLVAQGGTVLKAHRKIFDEANCVVLCPIPPRWWENSPLDKFCSYAFAHYRIDRSRVYIVGLSAGGDGVLDYVAQHGEDFAACVPIAFSHNKGNWAKFAQVPTWVFENWKDPYDGGGNDAQRRNTILFCNKIAQLLSGAATPTDMLANFPEANLGTTQPTQTYTGVYTVAEGWKWSVGINAVNGPPLRMTQWKNQGHGGWGDAYDSAEMWKWLLAQRRNVAATGATTRPSDK